MNIDPKELLVWVDLETTGLDQDFNMLGCIQHKILEIGIHITDGKLNIIDEGLNIVIHHDIDEILNISSPYVIQMHTNNGLFEKVKESIIDLKDAEKMIMKHLEKHGVEKGVSPICGNNVSFDKNFINAQMPDIRDFLHYRKIDVSSFKELFKRIQPDIEKKVIKKLEHRDLDDIKESIDELKLYTNAMFKNTAEPVFENKKNKQYKH
jgi:oligoribonuclease